MHHPNGHTTALIAARPVRRRPRERAAGIAFRTLVRIAGLHPTMLPDHLRRQLRIIGVRDAQFTHVMSTMRSLSDWPYAWEAAGDACAAANDHEAAFAAYYVGQRILLAPGPLKARLYERAVDEYAHIEQPRLERFETHNEQGERIVGYLQMPEHPPAAGRPPCVVIVPGITGTKEELHAFAMPMLRRHVAVARIDNPTYGETEGHLTTASVPNARYVLDYLARDPRLDANSLHLYGMSLGANFAIEAALDSVAASLSVICAPFQPSRYVRNLPTSNLTALRYMTQIDDLEQLFGFLDASDRDATARRLRLPVNIFHGGRDATIPVDDAILLARALGGPTVTTIFERDHHNCLEHLDEVTAAVLEFVDDPHALCALRGPRVKRVDEAATIHVSDGDAALVRAGVHPPRKMIRLPFLLPGIRPTST